MTVASGCHLCGAVTVDAVLHQAWHDVLEAQAELLDHTTAGLRDVGDSIATALDLIATKEPTP